MTLVVDQRVLPVPSCFVSCDIKGKQGMGLLLIQLFGKIMLSAQKPDWCHGIHAGQAADISRQSRPAVLFSFAVCRVHNLC